MKSIYLCFICFALCCTSVNATSLTFAWTHDGINVDGFTICEGWSSLTCDNTHDVPDPYARTHTINVDDSNKFFSLIAYNATEESGNSTEIYRKVCDGIMCDLDIQVSENNGTVFLTHESVPSIVNYDLVCHDTQTGEVLNYEVQGSSHTFDLPSGSWEIYLYAKDAENRRITAGSIFPTQYLEIGYNPAPETPSFSAKTWHKNPLDTWDVSLAIGFGADNPYIDYFLINGYSTAELAQQGSGGDIINNEIAYYGDNFCTNVNMTDYKFIFLTVNAVDYDGRMSDSYLGYDLLANIVGNEYSSPYVPYENAVVDGSEYGAYRTFRGQSVPYASSDFCSDPDLYNILRSLSVIQRTDLNDNGVIDSLDGNIIFKVLRK